MQPARNRKGSHEYPAQRSAPDNRCGTAGRRDAMTAAIETRNLGRQYGSVWALTGCTLEIPAGCVTGLVGPNGAGKTTLLNLATGMRRPSSGSIRVLGGTPGRGTEQLRKVGFVAQDTPVYAGLSVADHLKLGQHLNARWDGDLAASRISELKLDPRR